MEVIIKYNNNNKTSYKTIFTKYFMYFSKPNNPKKKKHSFHLIFNQQGL